MPSKTTTATAPAKKIVKKESDNNAVKTKPVATKAVTKNNNNNNNNKTKNTKSAAPKQTATTTTATTTNNNKKRKAVDQPSSSPSSKKSKTSTNNTKPAKIEEEEEDDDLAVSSEDDSDTHMAAEGEASEDSEMEDENHIPLSKSNTPSSTTTAATTTTSAKPKKSSKVICLSRLPFGMEENQLRDFLTQFGKIEQIRVSRNRITGKSRGYAFVMFDQPIVAEIVCDTLHDYFFGIRRLHCRLVPTEKIHADLFKPIPVFKVHPQEIVKRQFNARMKDTSEEAVANRNRNLLSKQKKLAKRLQASNIQYSAPGAVQISKRTRLPTLKQMKRKPALKYNLSKERALLALSGKPYFSKEK